MASAAESVTDLREGANPAAQATEAAAAPIDMDSFLASVERRAFRMAELALGHREDALDAVQEAMIRLLRYRARPASEWTPLFWSILRSQITDRHRRNGIRRRVLVWLGRDEEAGADPIDALPDPGLDPLGRQVEDQRWLAIGVALRMLPRRQRECFMLRELQGLSVADTARAMGCSEGSVKTHLSRAMAALRSHLEDWR